MLGLEDYLHHCGLEEPLLDLVKLRASQINGCAYCIDMHWKICVRLAKASSAFTDWTHGKNLLTTLI